MFPQVSILVFVCLSSDGTTGQRGQEQALPQLISRLSAKDRGTRLQTIRKLSKLGRQARNALPHLIALLGDEDRDIAEEVVGAVLNIGPDAVPSLGKALNSENTQTRRLAIRILSTAGWERKVVLPILLDALSHKKNDVRREAVYAINGNGDGTAVLPLLRVAQEDSDRWVRREAIRSLASVGDAAAPAASALVKLIKDESRAVDDPCQLASEAAGALAVIGEKAIPSLVSVIADSKNSSVVRSLALSSLSKMNARQPGRLKRIVPILIELVDKRDRDLCWSSVSLLGSIGKDATAALPALSRLMGQTSGVGKVAAAEGLYLISGRSEKILPVLLRALQATDASVRSSAGSVIGRLRPIPAAAIPLLLQACRDADTNVRLQAVLAFDSMRPLPKDVLRVLRSCLQDKSEIVRLTAERLLGDEPEQLGRASSHKSEK